MGAYLSQPKTDKVSTDELNELLRVGASSMQGWRNSQEDAHNSILNYDENTSFFAVYDGHGGAEVATYCADKLPVFLKELAAYNNGQFESALREAFLGFDKSLLEPKVVDILKILAGEKNADADESEAEEDIEDLVELHEESHLPLNEVLEKYKGGPSMPLLKKLKESASCASGSKPQSPYLRGRRAAAVAAEAVNKAVMDPDSKPQGSSTSAAAAAAAAAVNDAGPSSSSKALPSKMDTDEPEEDSTVSSSSSSASKSNNNSNAADETTPKLPPPTADTPNITTNGNGAAETAAGSAPDSSHLKENEQNGSVTSTQVKAKKEDVSTSAEATVSGSADETKRIQNGTVGSTSSTSAAAAKAANAPDGAAAISSTSKEARKGKKMSEDDSTDDDADYDAENSSVDEIDARNTLIYSSDEDADDDGENSSAEDTSDDEIDEDGDEDEEDDETAIANEQFCANMIEEPGKDSGCTAVVALLNGRDLYVANAGDSRCVVSRKGKAIDMSLDHKPEDDEESARIIKAGGRVTLDGRVNGGLNLSRAIGDHAYKMKLELPAEEQMISALPDIKKLIITPDDEFMVLACDGIWNYMSSEEVVDFVRTRLKDENRKISEICEELFDNCLAPNTMGDGTGCDNMTAVIVRFLPKLLELPTKIDPKETEDLLIAKQAAESDAADASLQKSLKRSASADSGNEAEDANQTKRMKTDEESSSNKNTNTTTTTATKPTHSIDNATSSSSSSSSSTSIEAASADQTDGVSSNEAAAAASST